MSATWLVPSAPTLPDFNPALWFGLQTHAGDGALIQPILKWFDNAWYLFHEVFDWTDESFQWGGARLEVQPGESITGELAYRQEDDSYDMVLTAAGSSARTLKYSYKLKAEQKANESTAYFVLEHRPSSCAELPANGGITFFDVNIQVEGVSVTTPEWVAAQKNPVCGSQAIVVDPRTIAIAWDPSARSPLATGASLRGASAEIEPMQVLLM